MEITCTRCHQPVPAESCFCPACGLPQLVYSTEDSSGTLPAERGPVIPRDANSVEWKSALRAALLLAIPAGLLAFGTFPVGLIWTAACAAWAVSLYVRRLKPGWITTSAGARIGLVTGLISGWMAFCATGVTFFCTRFWFHQGESFDQMWQAVVYQGTQPQMQVDLQAATAMRNLMLSPQGRAGFSLTITLILEVALIAFAAAGGAVGARLMTRSQGR